MKFSRFIKLTFDTILPDCKYRSNWHIRVIADRLQAAYDGKITRLIISVPPRFMKSICVSIAWPAWILGLNPCARIIVASYSQILSEKLSLDTRCILQSPWYRKMFPEVEISSAQNTKRKFQTTKLGFRFATSVGGSVTGDGGNFLIVDDPLNSLQSESISYRKRAYDWFNQTFLTRLNDRKKGVVVIVMHRLHTEDLVGQILSSHSSKRWHVLSIPLISEKKSTFYSLAGNTTKTPARKILYVRQRNEPIMKNIGSRFLENLKSDIGTYAFASQFQQNPINVTGSGLIKYNWLRRYVHGEYSPNTTSIIQSWDTASTARCSSSFSVCSTWAVHCSSIYLIDIYRKRADYQTLKKDFVKIQEKWNPVSIIIEEKSSGYQLINEFRDRLPIFPFKPISCKLTRVMNCIPFIQAGFLFLPFHAPWLCDFERELCSFPSTDHTDQVDSMSQAIMWIRETLTVDSSPQLREV